MADKKQKRATIEVKENTRDEFSERAKAVGMTYDGFLRSLLAATKPSQKGK